MILLVIGVGLMLNSLWSILLAAPMGSVLLKVWQYAITVDAGGVQTSSPQ